MPWCRWRRNITTVHWSCWSPPGRAEGDAGPAVLAAPCDGDKVVRGRLPGARLPGSPSLQPEHLAARAQAEAELRNDRRALQPAAARRRRDHVAPAVDHVEVAGVAGRRMPGPAPRSARRCLRAPEFAFPAAPAITGLGAIAGDASGPQLERGFCADQLAAARRCRRATSSVSHRHFDEIGIAVVRLSVGEGELGAFDDGMDEIRAERIQPVEVEAVAAARIAAAAPAPAPRARS